MFDCWNHIIVLYNKKKDDEYYDDTDEAYYDQVTMMTAVMVRFGGQVYLFLLILLLILLNSFLSLLRLHNLLNAHTLPPTIPPTIAHFSDCMCMHECCRASERRSTINMKKSTTKKQQPQHGR